MSNCLKPTKTTWFVMLGLIILVLLMIVYTYAGINDHDISTTNQTKGFWQNLSIFTSFILIIAPAYLLDGVVGTTLRIDSLSPIPNTFGYVVDVIVWVIIFYIFSSIITWFACKFKEMYEE
jgi:hypothetical protein